MCCPSVKHKVRLTMYTGVPVRRVSGLSPTSCCAQPKSMAFSQPDGGQSPGCRLCSGWSSGFASRKLAGCTLTSSWVSDLGQIRLHADDVVYRWQVEMVGKCAVCSQSSSSLDQRTLMSPWQTERRWQDATTFSTSNSTTAARCSASAPFFCIGVRITGISRHAETQSRAQALVL